MTPIRKLSLILASVLISTTIHAQVEVAHLFYNGQSATGFGTFLHAGAPVGKDGEVSGEAGLYYFSTGGYHIAWVPFLAGYRRTFNGKSAGFYVEPFAGYSVGATDIPTTNASGQTVTNADGSEKDVKLSGPIAGLGLGYIIPSANIPINFGLRYEHVFVSGAPAPSSLSFRISWSLLTARRLQAN